MTATAPAVEPVEQAAAPSIGWYGALAGALGAAAALTVIEVLALVDATGDSVTEATGNAFIDAFAAQLKDIAIELFGHNDKAALLIGTAVIAMAIGAWLGTRALKRPVTVVVGFSVFGLLGIVLSLQDTLASPVLSIVASVLGAAAGIGVTLGLARRWQAAAGRAARLPAGGPAMLRRSVLLDGGITAAVLLLGVGISRAARAAARSVAATVNRALPKATPAVAVPAGTLDKGPEAIRGISPYVTPTDDFYRIDTLFRAPVVDTDSWTLDHRRHGRPRARVQLRRLLARDLVEVPSRCRAYPTRSAATSSATPAGPASASPTCSKRRACRQGPSRSWASRWTASRPGSPSRSPWTAAMRCSSSG